jgi:hypothetical protein
MKDDFVGSKSSPNGGFVTENEVWGLMGPVRSYEVDGRWSSSIPETSNDIWDCELCMIFE